MKHVAGFILAVGLYVAIGVGLFCLVDAVLPAFWVHAWYSPAIYWLLLLSHVGVMYLIARTPLLDDMFTRLDKPPK